MSQAGSLGINGGGGTLKTINGDTGSITGATVTIYADQAALNSGSSVSFVNSGTISTLNLSDANQNTILGSLAGTATLSGLTGGVNNVSLGHSSSNSLTTGQNNTTIGRNSGASLVNGSANTLLGQASGISCISGSNNVLVGNSAGGNYTSSESSNIMIGNTGVVGESNIIRIGTQGTGAGQQNKAYVAGIAGTTTSNSQMVTVDSTTGQLGAATIPSGATSFIDQGTGITLAANTGYFVTAATTQTLPASPSQGDLVIVVCDTAGAVVVTANTGQTIRLGSSISSSAGTLTSTAIGDSLTLRYRASGTKWIATASVGTWTIA